MNDEKTPNPGGNTYKVYVDPAALGDETTLVRVFDYDQDALRLSLRMISGFTDRPITDLVYAMDEAIELSPAPKAAHANRDSFLSQFTPRYGAPVK